MPEQCAPRARDPVLLARRCCFFPSSDEEGCSLSERGGRVKQDRLWLRHNLKVSLRRNLVLKKDQIVPMYEFRLIDVAELGLDLVRRCTQDAAHLRRVVVDQTARNLAT